ncbi:NADP-dependent oxidoreductase domain-containing protein [Mycena floridula]|nr:NADP-dependent oxidoreductase domain-containing protein [Mycena floridula]
MLSLTLNDGTQMPWIAFGSGTAHLKQDATDAIRMAIENGFTHLDTAQMYGNESSVGAAWTASGKAREELYITTKLPLDLAPGETVRSSLVASLEKLQTSYVDLYLIHSPRSAPRNKMTPSELWKEMEALKSEGLARSIEDLEEILKDCTVIPAANQIEFHPYLLKASQDYVQLCFKHKIVVTSYGSMTPVTRKVGGPVDAAVEAIIKRVDGSATASQVLAKWVVQKGIAYFNQKERVKEYLAAEQVPDLTPEEVAAIDEAGYNGATEPRVIAFYKNLDATEQAK